MQLGHDVWLVPPIYVKPFVKRQKNDAADAEAICEAAQRPTMRFVAVKEEEQQARAMLFHTRDLLVRQRTQTINALRGHLAEFGVVAPQGPGRISKMGQRDLRRLLIIGAMAVVSSAVRHGETNDPWLARMLARKPRMLVAVALANKMARIVWALMTRKETCRGFAPAAA